MQVFLLKLEHIRINFISSVLGSIFFNPRTYPSLPPLPQRMGFSAIMYGAGYALSTGDATNGSGISTGKIPLAD